MTHLIPVRSNKTQRGLRFAGELNRAMRERGVGSRPIAVAAGVTRTSIMYWRTGRVLPRTETAHRLAETLDWPKLASLASELRRKTCAIDGREFVDDSGSDNRIYCSESCKNVGRKQRVGRDVRLSSVRAERGLERHRVAVADYCHGCEPEGLCRYAECALRSVSPLPFVARRPA